MEGVLGFLQRMVLIFMGVFAIYQCFQVGESGTGIFARPAAGWTARACLILIAGVCFFTVARILGTR